jgi:Thaumatin family/Malectin domain
MKARPRMCNRRMCIGFALLLITAVVLAASQSADAQTFTVVNNCGYTVWPGLYPAVFDNGGWEMAPGTSVNFPIPAGFNGRFWGRIACNGASPAQCATGQCGGTGIQCAGTTGVAGTSLAEFNVNAGGTDYYDVSYVDGFDNPIGVEVSNASCVSPNSCTDQPFTMCPNDGELHGDDCVSPCTATGNPEFCCAGAFGTPATCQPSTWPAADAQYVTNIHTYCPDEYAYAYDDPVGLHTCPTGASYKITFCPGANQITCTTPSAPAGLAATAVSSSQINLSWVASSSSCSVTYNVYRSTTSGFTPSSSNQIASGVGGAAYSNTGLAASTTYYYVVKGTNSGGTSGASNQASATTQSSTTGTQLIAIDSGSTTVVSPFVADEDFSGGMTIDHANTINTSNVTNPAPAAVYQTARVAVTTAGPGTTYSYTIGGFTAGTDYLVRLHFCETFFTSAGKRTFDVSINGAEVLTGFDIFATAGGQNIANIQQFTEPANSSGQFVIVFTSVVNNALISGIEIDSTTAPPPPTVQINSGGPAVSPFVADEDFTGGETIDHANTINTSNVTNPAPAAVYQSARVTTTAGAGTTFSYTIPGFAAGSSHTVRLHFCETFWTAAGDRKFNVSINGTQVLTDFDIFATAGGQNIANIQEFTEAANASGDYVLTFTSDVDKALISGIEIQ